MRVRREAILERVAGARRRLRAIADHPPAAVRRAREVGGVEVQEAALRRLDAVARPQEARVREHQLRRQQPVAQQVLRTVEVGEDEVQELRALRERGFDGRATRPAGTSSGTASSSQGRSMPCGSP